MNRLDKTDQSLLTILQNSFPLTLRPYQDIANQLAISEDEVLERIGRMKAEGLIRRVGGIMESGRLGFYSTLCAITVPAERIDEVAAVINENTGVTHNYLRDHHYNMWFTITCKSQQEAQRQIKGLEESIACKIISMPTRKVYKIKVSFDMGDINER